MGKVVILEYTTKEPLTMIGKMAGICWNSDTSDKGKNKERAIDCIRSDHGRTLEFPDIYATLDGYSARVMREWYTHIGCLPSRLQSSTRYVKWSGNLEDGMIIPPSVAKAISSDPATKRDFDYFQNSFLDLIKRLEQQGINKEDIAMFYPLGMKSKMVDKRNLRNVIDMSHQRMCSRAYWEYRQLFSDYAKALSNYSEEWKCLVDNCFMRKCQFLKHCPEKHSCGFYEASLKTQFMGF